MLQKELAKRLRGRFETEMDGDGWLAVSSDGMPLCRVKYNGNCVVNDNPYLSEEYLGKIAEVQNELLTVKDYVALYEHAPQMKAADVSEYRQLTVIDSPTAATNLGAGTRLAESPQRSAACVVDKYFMALDLPQSIIFKKLNNIKQFSKSHN